MASQERLLADRLGEARTATDAALASQRERLLAQEQLLADRLACGELGEDDYRSVGHGDGPWPGAGRRLRSSCVRLRLPTLSDAELPWARVEG